MGNENEHKSIWIIVSVLLCLALIISWIFFLNTFRAVKTETFLGSADSDGGPGFSPPTDKTIMELNSRYACPSDMAVIPGAQHYSLDYLGENPDPATPPANVPTFCMDVFEFPNKKNAIPTTRVTRTAAVSSCKKQGKRLCSEVEWEIACTGRHGHPFTYGDQKQDWRCNTDGVQAGSYEWIAPSGSHPGCRNEYGVYDLNGNVSEWVESQKEQDLGVVRGGTAWYSEDYGQSCFSRHKHPVGETWPDDGFRCCKSAVPKGDQ